MKDSTKEEIKEFLENLENAKKALTDDYEEFYESNTYADIEEYWNKNDGIVGDTIDTIEECYDLLKSILEELEDEE